MSQPEEQILEERLAHERALATLRNTGLEGPQAEMLFAQHADTIDLLDERLADVRLGRLEIVLNVEQESGKAVAAPVLAGVIGRMQRSLDWAVHAFKYGPGVESQPPVDVRALTAVEVEAFAPGSFRILMRRTPPDDARQEQIATGDIDLFEQAIQSILDLSSAAESGDFAESVEDVAQSLGPKATRQIQGLMANIAESGGTTGLFWASKSPRAVQLSAESARALKTWLAEVESTTEQRSITGTLLGADVQAGRFRMTRETSSRGRRQPSLFPTSRQMLAMQSL
jgi:hypothetical protein